MSSPDLPKLWSTSSKFAKFVLSQSFFGIKNQQNLSDFFSVKNIGQGDKLLKTKFFENFYLLTMCPIFVGSVYNFGKSDDVIIKWNSAYFQ